MKKRLSVLLIGSLVAISLAGCSGSTTTPETSAVPAESTSESSVQSAETSENGKVSSETSGNTEKEETSRTSENSVTSETPETSQNEESAAPSSEEIEDIGPKEGDIVVDEEGNEFIYHENDGDTSYEPIEETSMDMTPDGSEAVPKYLDVTYTPINGKDANMDVNSIDMDNPVYYTVASTQELKEFVDTYGAKYSLNDVESGVTFNALAEKFDDTYFAGMELIVIPAKYDKDEDAEIGTITIEGDNYNIEVCTPISGSAQTESLCFVVQANKSELENKNIVLRVVKDSMIMEGDEEI